MMRVALIEDHLITRDLLRRACEDEFGFTVVFECDRGALAVNAVTARGVDLAILDLALPDRDGLVLIDELRRAKADMRLLVLSSRFDDYTVYRLEKARVTGFIDKNGQMLPMLEEALAAVQRGETYFSPAFQQARRARQEDPLSFDKVLSEREQAVLACLGDCLTDEEMAVQLGVSPQTAEMHRFNVQHKLALPGTPALMRYAQTHGFHRARLPRA